MHLTTEPHVTSPEVSVDGKSLVLKGEFSPGIFKVDLATRPGLPTDSLFVSFKKLAEEYEILTQLPSSDTVTGPWDHVNGRIVLPWLEVHLDGAFLGRTWADLPSLVDLPAGRYRFSTGIEIEAAGLHEICFRLPDDEQRLGAADLEEMSVAPDEREPSPSMESLQKRVEGHPQILLTREHLDCLRNLPPGPHRRVVDALCEVAPQIPLGDAGARESFHTVEAVALAAAITGEREHAARAFARAKAIADLPYWGGCPNPHEMGHDNDIAAGGNLYALAIVYDWLHDLLGPEELAFLRGKIFEKAREQYLFSVLQRDYWPTGFAQNHMHAATLGLGVAGLLFMDEDGEARKWAIWVRTLYQHVFDRYASDGTQPPVTYTYGLQFICRYQEALRVATGIDLFDHPQFRLLATYALAESRGARPGVQFGLHALLCREASVAGDYIGHLIDRGIEDGATDRLGRDATLALWYRPGPRKQEIGLPPCQYFADGGLAFMRSGWFDGGPWLRVFCGPPGGHSVFHRISRYDCAHYEPNAGSFTLTHAGRSVVASPGGSYQKLTRHHNTVTVNGVGQFSDGRVWSALPGPGQFGVIRRFSDHAGHCLVHCDLTGAYPEEAKLEGLHRYLLFIKPSVFVVIDEIETGGPGTVQWWLHHPGKIQRNEERRFLLTGSDPHYALDFVEPVSLAAQMDTALVVRSYTNSGEPPTGLCVEADCDRKARFVAVLAPEGSVQPIEGPAEDKLSLEVPDAVLPGEVIVGSTAISWRPGQS